MSTLKDYYNSTVAPAMMKKFNYENVMQIPKLDKVVVNVGSRRSKGKRKGDRRDHDRSWQQSPVRSRSSAVQRSLSQTSNCVRACRSA